MAKSSSETLCGFRPHKVIFVARYMVEKVKTILQKWLYPGFDDSAESVARRHENGVKRLLFIL